MHTKREQKSFLMKLWGLMTYLFSVFLGVVIVLMLMEPKDLPPVESQSVPNAPALMENLVSSSRFSPAVASQQLINSLLRTCRHVAWKPPLDSIPALEWSEERVFLGNNVATYSFVLLVVNYPLHFSETFRLSGTSHQWSLDPETGFMGLLPLNPYILPILTRLAAESVTPLEKYLSTLKNAQTLEMRYGSLVFTTSPAH
jgi:hypothetical protein